MALIKCPECGKKISDQCRNCPGCGYPIQSISSRKYEVGVETGNCASGSPLDVFPVRKKKSICKRVWFWFAIFILLAAAGASALFLLSREVEPKVDEYGNPIFLELTDEIYTNADEYLGYYVNVKGKVFQKLGDNGEEKGIQVWIDPDNCEQNIMIHYTTDETFKDGDYVICSGYIKKIHQYTNTYGTELSVPLIYSTDLIGASYIDVMAPTISTIAFENLLYTKHGYSVTVDKVEYAENETRLYLSVSNKGNATLYVDTASSVIVQDGKQFNSANNFEADYEEVPYKLNKGTTSSGVVVFPPINEGEFAYVIELRSDNVKERFETITFKISEESSSVYIPIVKPYAVWNFDNLKYETKGYAITIDKIEFYDEETLVFLTATNDGKAALYVNADNSVIVQNKKQFNAENIYDSNHEELPRYIARGVSASGVISYPSIRSNEFEYTISMHSDDYKEEFKDIVFTIKKEYPICQNEENEAWRLKVIINTDPYDNENNKASISKYEPIYLHFHVLGGKPGEIIKIKEVMTFPDGEKYTKALEGRYTTNHKETWVWAKGIYKDPELGANGTLKFYYYNADTGEQIGGAAVQITN